MSNSIQLTGRIKTISDEQTIQTRNGDLTKRTLILTLGAESDYPVDYPIEAIGPKANLFTAYKPNDEVAVSVNLRSYQGKDGELRTANANAWKITYADGSLPKTSTTYADNVDTFVNQDSELSF